MQAVHEAELATKLEVLFSEALGRELDGDSRNCKISSLDIPSLSMMLMLVQVENEYGIEFSGDDFDRIANGTFDDFVALIRAGGSTR